MVNILTTKLRVSGTQPSVATHAEFTQKYVSLCLRSPRARRNATTIYIDTDGGSVTLPCSFTLFVLISYKNMYVQLYYHKRVPRRLAPQPTASNWKKTKLLATTRIHTQECSLLQIHSSVGTIIVTAQEQVTIFPPVSKY